MKSNSFNRYRYYGALLSCLFLFSVLIACNNNQYLKADHPALMQKFADSTYYLVDKAGLKTAINHLNIQYAQIKEPGFGDQIEYFRSKQRAYYQSFHWDFDKINAAYALSYSDSILNLIEKNKVKIHYLKEYLTANIAKGDIYYYALNKYDTALNYYFKDKALIDQLSSCDQVDFTNRFAVIDFKEGKFRPAAALFMQEFHQRLSCKMDFESFASTQRALNNAGACYNELEMSDSAIYCFNGVLKYVDKYASQYPVHKRFILDVHGVANGYLGSAYLIKGENKEAEEHYKESIRLDSKGGNEGKNAQEIQIRLARLYLTTGRIKQADSTIEQIKHSLDTLSNELVTLQWNKLNADYYNFLNKPQKAAYYFQIYTKFKTQADQASKSKIENDVDRYFSTVQQRYDQALLKKQKQLNSLQLALFIGLVLFILYITFQIWNNWRTARKSNFELNELNSSLKNTLGVLQQSQDENNRLLKVVAHDLNSPISSIFSLTSLMLDTEEQSPRGRTMLELIKTSGRNCMNLVDDLLKTNIRPGALKKEKVDLAEVLSHCVAQLKPKADTKEQHLVLSVQPCNVQGNQEKLWRVANNLIVNAIKFSPEGAIIKITLEETEKGAIIAVKDHGIGIPDEMKGKIFNMFADAMRPGTGGEPSFGMGLAISKQIIEAHGGNIWFESTPGNGTTFFIELTRTNE